MRPSGPVGGMRLSPFGGTCYRRMPDSRCLAANPVVCRGDRRMSRIVTVLALLAAILVGLPAGQVASAAVPAGFTDTAVISGLTAPTQAAFAADGRVFIAEKSGIIKVFDGLGDTTP